ncbi:glycosyl transferase family 2, partial [Mycobacterium sp. ITM-2017-0098]
EPRPGLSRARNTGLSAATGEVVAFTDDDVVVDRHWLSAIARGFSRGPAVSCVSGIVAAAELRTPAQAY